MEEFKNGVVAILMIALIAGALAIALDAFRTDRILDETVTTVTDESHALTNGTAVSLNNDWVASVTTVKALVNTTNATLVLNTDYTVASTGSDTPATITLINAAYTGNTSYTTYTYHNDAAMHDANITQEGLEGLGNATSYLSTIGTLFGVAALIAIVVGAFMFVRR